MVYTISKDYPFQEVGHTIILAFNLRETPWLFGLTFFTENPFRRGLCRLTIGSFGNLYGAKLAYCGTLVIFSRGFISFGHASTHSKHLTQSQTP